MKKSIAAIGLAFATTMGAAQASPTTLSNLPDLFKSAKAAPPNNRPAPPWTSTTNPVANPVLYLGGPVIVSISLGSYQIGWLSAVTNSGNVGTTPMLEDVLTIGSYTGLGTTSCEIFDNATDANAAITYGQQYGGYPGFNFGCVGYINPNAY